MDPLQSIPCRFKGEPEDGLKESRLFNVQRRKPVAWTRRGLEERDDDVPQPVSGRGTNEESENKKYPVLGQDITEGDEESLMSGITMDPAIHCIEGEASVEVHPSVKWKGNREITVGDPDVDDAYDPNNHVSDEIPTRGTIASEERNDNAECAIRSRLLRVAVPLMMTPFSFGGIVVSSVCIWSLQ
jgi:hypothetical protein